MKKMLVLFIVSLTIISCSDKYTADSKDDLSSSSFVAEVQAYIDSYTETYMALDYDASEAQWQSNTMIV